MNRPRLATVSLMVLAAVVARLLPHAPNFTPVAAIALFAGATFENRLLALAVPLLALFLSDLVLGFYPHMGVTYTAFSCVVCVGFLLRGRTRLVPVAVATLASSTLFFTISNFAWWLPYDLYPKNTGGLIEGYMAALPFFRNTLLGDIFYAVVLFGGFALAEKRFAALRLSPSTEALPSGA